MRGIGDNGGPRLDDADRTPSLPYDAACCRCRHWTPPHERDEADFRAFQAGVKMRRVKEPSGACGHVQHRPGGPLSFSATLARSRCFNFAAKPPSGRDPRTRGHVTIWQGDRVLWQGTEGEEPAEYRQEELPL